MTVKALLLEIGAGPLPATTPTAPVAASWYPKVYTAPPPSVPVGFTAVALVGGVRVSWNVVAGDSIAYELQRAPDAGGVAGTWVTVSDSAAPIYNSNESAKTWWRVRTLRRGVPSDWSASISATPIASATPGDVSAVADAAAAAQAAADAAQAAVDAEEAARAAAVTNALIAAAADATAKANAAKAEATARSNALQAQINDVVGTADDWVSTTAYPQGDSVRYSGHLYRAKQAVPANTPPPNATYWEDVGNYSSVGEAVAAAVAMSVQNASDIEVESTRTDGLVARMPAGSGTLATNAQVSNEETVRANADTALGESITAVQASLDAAMQGLSISAGQTSVNDWIVTSGTGEVSTIASADNTVMGGRLLQVGNNAGNDMAWMRYKDLIPYDPTKLYRVRVRARVDAGSSGSPLWYGGLAGLTSDKSQYVSTGGGASSGLAGSHYVAVAKSNTAYEEVVGYFKGQSVGARTGLGTVASPWTMPDTVSWITPMLLGNYNGQTGRSYFDKIIIEDADAIGADASTASAVAALDARVTSAEGSVSSHSSQITSLNNSIGSIGGAGDNLLPDEYTYWRDGQDVSAARMFRTGETTAVVADAGTPSGYALKITSTNTTTTSRVVFSTVDASSAASLANLPIAPGKYLVSFYAKSDTDGHLVALAWQGADLTTATSANIPLTTSWARYSAIVNLSAQTAPGAVLWIRPNRSGVSGRVVYLDRVQIEPLLLENNVPSAWRPGMANADVAANSSALSAIDSRVTAAEGSITSQAGNITSLTASVGSANASITELSQVVASSNGSGLAIPNPSFEYNYGWGEYNSSPGGPTLAAETNYSTANPVTGKRTLRYGLTSPNSITAARYNSSPSIPIDTNKPLRLVFWSRITQSPNNSAKLRGSLDWYDANDTYISRSYVDYPCSNHSPTRRLNPWVTPPAGAAYVRVVIGITAAQTSMYCYIDDVSVEVQSTTDEVALATVGVLLDVNGKVAGYKLSNDGTIGDFAIVADKFSVVGPTSGARTEFSDGNWRVYRASGALLGRWGTW